MNLSVIEQALFSNTRIQTSKGLLGVEKLVELPLQSATTDGLSLNSLAQELNTILQTSKDFVQPEVKTPAAAKAERDLALVVRIIEVKREQAKEKQDGAFRAQRLSELRGQLAKREAEKFEGLTTEQLQAQIAALEKGE